MSYHGSVKLEERSPRPGSSRESLFGRDSVSFVDSRRSRDLRYENEQTTNRPDTARSGGSSSSRVRQSPARYRVGETPERRRGRGRPNSPHQPNNRRSQGRNDEFRQRHDRPIGQRDSNRGRARGFHYGKNLAQSRPYFNHGRGRARGRGTGHRFQTPGSNVDTTHRRVLLDTPVERYPSQYTRDYGVSSPPWRASRTHDLHRDSVASTHGTDFFTQDQFPSSPSLHRPPGPTDRLYHVHPSPCETTSQSSSSSVIYNSSHKRSLEMVMRDCSPVSDEDQSSPKRTRAARLPKITSPVGPDSTTVCDMDISLTESINQASDDAEEPFLPPVSPPPVETDFNEISRLTERLIHGPIDSSVKEKSADVTSSEEEDAVLVVDEQEDTVVDDLIEQAWESPVVVVVDDGLAAEPTAPTGGQSTGISSHGAVEPPRRTARSLVRSSSCPPCPEGGSSAVFCRTAVGSRPGISHWLKNIVETDRDTPEIPSRGPAGRQSARTFADVMSLLPACEAKTLCNLDDYQPPLFSTKFAWADPFVNLRRPLQKSSNPGDLTSFFDTLHAVEDADMPFPIGSPAFTALFQRLLDGLDFAIGSAVWFRGTDSPDEQLGVHFLHAVKMCLLEQLRDFPSVSQPDLTVTRIALDMLLHAIIHIDGLADCMAQLGLTVALNDIIFSTIISTHYRKLTCSIMEVFLLRVSQYSSIKHFSDLLLKNGGIVLPDIKEGLNRLQLLIDLRTTVEVTRNAVPRPLADLNIQDKTLIATVQTVREDTNAKVLRTVIDKITPYRAISGKDGLQTHIATFICLKSANFMDWYVETLRQLLTCSSAETLRKSSVLDLSLTFLKLILEDEYGPAFLADRASHAAETIHVLHDIAVASSLETITELLQRVVYSLEISRTVDLLATRQTTDLYNHLAGLLLRMNCSQNSGSFYLTDASYHIVIRAVSLAPEPIGKVIFALALSHYHRPGILSLPDLSQMAEEGGAVDLPLWQSMQWISSIAKSATSCPDLLKFLLAQMVTLTGATAFSPNFLATAHVLLDTYLYLCKSDRFRSAIQSQGPELFLKVYHIVLEHFRQISASSEPVDCLDNLLWECVWVNSVRILTIMVKSPDGTFLELIQGWSLLHTAGLPIRPYTKRDLEGEFGACCGPFVKQILDASSANAVQTTRLYGVVMNCLASATGPDADLPEAVAYWAFVNTLYPWIMKSASSKPKMRPETRLVRRTNWETMNKLDCHQLQQLITVGLCCTASDFDASFRLWFWRYCEISDACLAQGMASLLYIVCGAVMEDVDCDVLTRMLQKLASLLRISTLRRQAALLLLEEEPDVEWKPESFDAVLGLVKQAAVYTETHRQAFLLPVARILMHLVEALTVSKGPAVAYKLREIASVVICRLQKEASVPVILCLWPVLSQLFQTDAGILAFLNEATSQPVLNWLLVAIARDLRGDPTVGALVHLAEHIVSGFISLTKRPPGTRTVSLKDLRTSSNMVVAYTRNCDPDKPSYRIPQNRDPDAIVSADFDDSVLVPDNVGKLQQIVQRMLCEFSRVDDPSSRFFQRKTDRVLTSVVKKSGILAKERYVKLATSAVLSSCDMGNDYERWQEREVKFHLFVERNGADVNRRYIVDEETVTRLELDEWLRRKTGVTENVFE